MVSTLKTRIVTFYAVLLWPAVALSQTSHAPVDLCQAPKESGTRDFEIDARTGAGRGRTRNGQHQQVRVVVINQNPYLFDYRLAIEQAAVPGPSIGDFLGLFGVKFDPPDPKAATKPVQEPEAADVLPCPSAKALEHGTDRLIDSVQRASGEWQKLQGPFDTAIKAHEIAAKVFDDANATCGVLQTASAGFLSELEKFEFKPGPAKSALQTLNAEAVLQDNLIAKVANEQGGSCKQQVEGARLALAGATAEAGKLQQNLAAAQDASKRLQAVQTGVQNTLATPGAFTQTAWISDVDNPTDVTITLSRRARKQDAAFADVTTRKLNFGGRALFAVSGGWSLGWVRRVEFGPVDGQARDRNGIPAGDSTQAIPIAEEIESSLPRSGPALLGHVRLVPMDRWLSGIHLTLGLSPQSDGDATRAEIFFGPSVSFADEMVFLSVTAYRGWQQTLEGTYYPGKALPPGSSTVPTGTDEEWGVGLSISFRIR